MRVLQVIDSLDVGGAERVFVNLTNLLYEQKIDVSILLLVSDGVLLNEINNNIPIIRLQRSKRFEFKKIKKLVEVIQGFDIVHVHLKHNYRYVCFSAKLFRVPISNIIFHDHSHSYGVKKISRKNLKDSFFKNLFKPKNYIGVSKENCLWAEKYLNLSKQNVFLLENTVRLSYQNKTKNARKGGVIVSNITPIKNLTFAIHLFKELKIPLTIYGKIRDKQYHLELLDLIDELHMKDDVKIITNCKHIQAELHKYVFAIHSSLKETGPLVLIEYLAQGLPFLSFNTGQVYEKLKPVIPEFFINNFDLECWKQQVSNIQKIDSMRIKTIYELYFNEINHFQVCLKIYHQILRY